MDQNSYCKLVDEAKEVLSIAALKATLSVHKKIKKIPTVSDVKIEMGMQPEEAYHLDPYIHRAMEILLAELIKLQSADKLFHWSKRTPSDIIKL